MEKPLLIADVNGDEIIVRTLGFFAYAKPSNAPQLILKRRTATVTTRSWLWPGKQRTTRRASSGGLCERSHLVSTGSPTGSFGGRASASLEQLGGAIETGRKRLTPMIQPAIGSGVPDVGFGPARGRWNASDAMSFVSTWTFFINSTSQTSGGSLR